jgi:hypothetical protein
MIPTFQLNSAVSRKMHGAAGAFDVPLSLSGSPSVECRSGGMNGDYTLVFTFSNDVASGDASVTSGTGMVSGSPIFAGKTLTVNLTGVTDVQTLTVTLSNVTDSFTQVAPDTAVSVNILIGDINADDIVNSNDISLDKSQSGADVTEANFRADVVADGSINTTDISLVKSRTGQSLQ